MSIPKFMIRTGKSCIKVFKRLTTITNSQNVNTTKRRRFRSKKIAPLPPTTERGSTITNDRLFPTINQTISEESEISTDYEPIYTENQNLRNIRIQNLQPISFSPMERRCQVDTDCKSQGSIQRYISAISPVKNFDLINHAFEDDGFGRSYPMSSTPLGSNSWLTGSLEDLDNSRNEALERSVNEYTHFF